MSIDTLYGQVDFPVSSIFRYICKIVLYTRPIIFCVVISHINYRCKWVKVHGDEYRVSTGVILNVVEDLPVIGIIRDIYVLNGDTIAFNVEEFSTSYEPHY